MSDSASQQSAKTQKKYLLTRLIELKNFLIGRASKGGKLLDIQTFSDKFLNRAPTALLETLTTEQLALLSEEAIQVLEDASKKPETLVLKRSPQHGGIFIALKDRPFIVSSLIEVSKSLGITLQALLHPIFTVQGNVYSLSFLFIPGATEAEYTALEKEIILVMNACISASDDFVPMKTIIERYKGVASTQSFIQRFVSSDNQEVKLFLDWLLDESFIFLGSIEHGWNNAGTIGSAKNALGILRDNSALTTSILKDCKEDLGVFTTLNEPLWLSKLSDLSPIHRRVRLSHLHIAGTDEKGSVCSVLSIIGLFSSKATSQEGQTIPLIRTKLRSLLESEELVSGSHDFKFVSDTINRMPKEEAIRLNRDGLRDIVDQTIDVYTRNESQVSIRLDASKRGASVVVLLPHEWYSESKRASIEKTIQTFFHVTPYHSESYIDTSAHGLARLYYHISFTSIPTQDFDSKALNSEIRAIVESFESKLLELASTQSEKELLRKNLSSFSESYRAIYSAQQAKNDVLVFDSLTAKNSIRVVPIIQENAVRLDIYLLNEKKTLSSLLPVLEYAGLTVKSNSSIAITLPSGNIVTIHRFDVETAVTSTILNAAAFSETVCNGLQEVLKGEAEDDVLLSLLISAGLSSNQILLLRSYTSHLWQFNAFPRKHQIREALAANPKAAVELWSYFDARFNPSYGSDRQQKVDMHLAAYEDEIRKESDILKDRVLRAMSKLIGATLRTNYYQQAKTLAHKIDPSLLDFVPEPRPWREIFVHSTTIEGVHLRTGPVSRGGLRWSERPDDFRTEVLGLVKTQKVKNVFIVPEGAKGGFIVRQMPSEQARVAETVKESYKEFIRAMLTLADNRSNEKVIPPLSVVRYDNDDPYFVVAADKGTATFSDTANSIAVDEAHFWLDDAFASGGSNGYDHKIYGITARGGWECVLRHFNDLGIDYKQQTFTAVGIGDMAGDVFGNGMILSDNMKLIAAFNHKHIFIDPTPDAKSSFAERNRLFENPKLQWSDYSASLISTGGGIFNRFDKEVKLSCEARTALGITSSQATFSGEEIIRAILCAPVDLLWNGGIGTYIKASFETHTQVNDSGNDRVRVSANDLRCRIVGEGGNLGLTQRARIEFSALGGRLNTDAIDNSGGVGLSDHEVNLKILFSGLLSSKKITRDSRNALLKEMAIEVCEQVLATNRAHAYRLTVSSERSIVQHEFFKGFIAFLASKGFVNRTLDALPQDDEIYQRLTNKQGFYRPELAVCLAAAKMWVKSLVLKSPVLHSKSLEKLLINYFPQTLHGKYLDAIKNHPLRDSIIATQATNYIIDILGISFLYRLMNSGSFSAETVLNAALAALIVFDAPRIVLELQKLDVPATCLEYIAIRSRFESNLRSVASWFAFRPDAHEVLDKTCETFGRDFFEVVKKIHSKEANQNTPQCLSVIDKDAAENIVMMGTATNALELYTLSQKENISIETAYANVEELKILLGLAGQENAKHKITATNRWEHALRRSSLSDIDRALMRLAGIAAQKKISTPKELKELVERSPSYDSLVQSINELTNIAPTVAHLAVIAGQFRNFVIVD